MDYNYRTVNYLLDVVLPAAPPFSSVGVGTGTTPPTTPVADVLASETADETAAVALEIKDAPCSVALDAAAPASLVAELTADEAEATTSLARDDADAVASLAALDTELAAAVMPNNSLIEFAIAGYRKLTLRNGRHDAADEAAHIARTGHRDRHHGHTHGRRKHGRSREITSPGRQHDRGHLVGEGHWHGRSRLLLTIPLGGHRSGRGLRAARGGGSFKGAGGRLGRLTVERRQFERGDLVADGDGVVLILSLSEHRQQSRQVAD